MAARAQRFKDHWKEQRLFLSRIIVSAVVVVLLTGLLIWRLVDLQIVRFERFSELSDDNQVRIESVPPTRGLIFDRKGRIIADNEPTWQLLAVPEDIDDLDGVLTQLEQIGLLDPTNHETLKETVLSHRRWEPALLANLDEVQAARFAVRGHQFNGIDLQAGLVRYYPNGEAVAHAVGYVGRISPSDLEQIDRANYSRTSHIGKTGVERAYEDVLHGTVGFRTRVVDAFGRPTDGQVPEGYQERRAPVPGDNIVVSLDLELQLAAEHAFEGMRGALVAIDPTTGDVLAMYSAPTFDTNKFATGMSSDEYVALTTDPGKPFVNRAMSKQYNPGSTVKPFYGLAGLYYETEHVSETHFCNGEFRLPNSSFVYEEGSRVRPHGEMTLHSAIVRSCNIYFYGLAHELEIDRMETFMRRFGFGSRTDIDIGGEYGGIMPGREYKRTRFSKREDQVWFPGETVITGIGQGYMEVTPLQLASATAAMAERGTRLEPRLLIATENAMTGEIASRPVTELEPLDDVDAEHWQIIHDAMLGVTVEARGTGHSAMLGTTYSVAGKTGTAQVVGVAQNSVYDADALEEEYRDNGLFIAFAPADKPEIAIAVVVENHGGGGSTAAPVARKVLDAYFGSEDYVAQLVTH
jgi:penicillin-binding protein 2